MPEILLLESPDPGRFWISNWLVDSYLPLISANEWKVLSVVHRHYNKAGFCFPSIGRIAKLAGINPETSSRCLHNLSLKGFYKMQPTINGHKVTYSYTDTTRFLLPDPPDFTKKPHGKPVPKEVIKEEIKELITNKFSSLSDFADREMPELYNKIGKK